MPKRKDPLVEGPIVYFYDKRQFKVIKDKLEKPLLSEDFYIRDNENINLMWLIQQMIDKTPKVNYVKKNCIVTLHSLYSMLYEHVNKMGSSDEYKEDLKRSKFKWKVSKTNIKHSCNIYNKIRSLNNQFRKYTKFEQDFFEIDVVTREDKRFRPLVFEVYDIDLKNPIKLYTKTNENKNKLKMLSIKYEKVQLQRYEKEINVNCIRKIDEIKFNDISRKKAERVVNNVLEKCLSKLNIPDIILGNSGHKLIKIEEKTIDVVIRKTQEFVRKYNTPIKNIKLYWVLGNTELIRAEFDNAINCYKNILGIDSSNVNALVGIGYSLSMKGELQKANQYFTKAVKLYEREPISNKVNINTWVPRGTALQGLGRHEAAIKCFDNAIDRTPDSEVAWNNKGISLKHLGKYYEALECYECAININPDYYLAWTNKGNTLKKLRKYNEAVECHKKALSINSKHGSIWYNLACVESLRNNIVNAINYLNKAIELSPRYSKLAKTDPDLKNLRI